MPKADAPVIILPVTLQKPASQRMPATLAARELLLVHKFPETRILRPEMKIPYSRFVKQLFPTITAPRTSGFELPNVNGVTLMLVALKFPRRIPQLLFQQVLP